VAEDTHAEGVVGTAGSLLIVDDEAAHLAALCNTLGSQGYTTVGASSGQDALAALRTHTFDLLLTDLKMPGMDGIALVREALSIDPNLVGVLMTGHGTIATAVEAMQVGALDYILKPFKLSAVLPVLTRALAVRRLRLENARLERNVRERTSELEAANKELDAFAYSVSHDLRAPLRAVNGFASILLREHGAEMSAQVRELVDDISAAGRRMEQLIEDLLRFSRLGRQPVSRMPVQLSTLIEDVLRELEPQHHDRRIDLRVGDLPEVVGDPSLLRQVFANLLSNAFKFTRGRDAATIEVGCKEVDGDRVFFVRDNGVGFDMRYASKLFGVFQRFHTQEQFPGTGVGLSLVQRIIQRHGGRIWAEAEVDKGAIFRFTLGET
jgi:two-component system sensor histidine kinase/response regulator